MFISEKQAEQKGEIDEAKIFAILNTINILNKTEEKEEIRFRFLLPINENGYEFFIQCTKCRRANHKSS